MAKKKITAFDIDTTKEAKEISKAFAGEQITPKKEGGRPPTEKQARKKFTIMVMPDLSHRLKMEALKNKMSASDYIENLLCEKFGINKDSLYD